MRPLGLILGLIFGAIGFRLIYAAGRAVFSGEVLVRRGLKANWEPAPTPADAWKIAFQNGLMGILLLTLAGFMIV